jgi:cell division protease FtsH
MSRRAPDLPPGQQGPPGAPQEGKRSGPSWPRWIPWVVIALIVGAFALTTLYSGGEDRESIDYSQLIADTREGRVEKVEITSSSGRINGEYSDGAKFTTLGPSDQVPERDLELFEEQGVDVEFKEESSNFLADLLPFLIPIALIILVFVWLNRRAQGQMAGIMNIGRSRAKVYTTEKPKTLFSDVAGYRGVKEEIAEVVDFLKKPAVFKEIGARTPKGVLLVGPPGTGKTLIARAVAGEAGVPFVSVTGSDFMEMFVGVGAARVRDMFQTARKQAPAIIFVDEIDSIGRKRGAGLGGGHDEREQTLNQMLAEMDGFETVEGVVMMAATNRPDILDPALLRPGRFDRQIMVPLPTQEERVDILKVHLKDKKIGDDVDPTLLARGTPGMSGADLANLVNEAALFAVRRGSQVVAAEDFDAARDRVLMGLKRESLALSEEEKEVVAYHEGGHAVLAYVLEHADPVHKVTILATGMALGVTHQLPLEERHIYLKDYIADSLVVRLGGRVAEDIVFGHLSTGANNDLVGCTELARKMVREWGMSNRIGPMAWGSQGAVFLGEDLVHTRDYSDETAHVIDEEVERILREEEDRARAVLTEHRAGLDAVARALRVRETLAGDEVSRLVDDAMGRHCGGPRKPVTADVPDEEAGPAPDSDGAGVPLPDVEPVHPAGGGQA